MKPRKIFKKSADLRPSEQDVFQDGTIYWQRDGQIHRDGGPALEGIDGTKMWYRNGLMHRDDGPAYEGADGTKQWWRDGKLHRDDGPAVERRDGHKEWWRDGKPVAAPTDAPADVLSRDIAVKGAIQPVKRKQKP